MGGHDDGRIRGALKELLSKGATEEEIQKRLTWLKDADASCGAKSKSFQPLAKKYIDTAAT